MITKPLMRTSVIALASVMSLGLAQAANFSKSAYDGAKDDIKARYKMEHDACGSQSGNARDICVEMAQANQRIALAQLEYNYSGDPKDEMKLWEARIDSRYQIAKEKCDDLAGKDKDVCTREAKTTHDKGKADLKLAKKTNDAAEDAEQTRLKADYKLAAEKCDAYNGDRKQSCIASAKAQYQQGW